MKRNQASQSAARYALARAALTQLVGLGEQGATGKELFAGDWLRNGGVTWSQKLMRRLGTWRHVTSARDIGAIGEPLRFRAAPSLAAVVENDSALGSLLFGNEAEAALQLAGEQGDAAGQDAAHGDSEPPPTGPITLFSQTEEPQPALSFAAQRGMLPPPGETDEPSLTDVMEALGMLTAVVQAAADGQIALVQRLVALEAKLEELHKLWR